MARNSFHFVAGNTLLSEFTDDEIETVLAHELGHHVNRDIPLSILFQSALTLGGLYLANLGLHWAVDYFGFEEVWDIAALPLFMLVMRLYGLVTMPLSNAYSRWRERLADRYALQATGRGAPMPPPWRVWPTRTWRMPTRSRGWSGSCIRTRR